MAKKKSKLIEVDFKHLGLSTLITVALAELVPTAFFTVTALLETRFLGSMKDSGFFGRSSYTIEDVLNYGNFAMAAGVILAVSLLIYLAVMIVDEYLFSHKLDSIGSVFLYGFFWATGYYLIDSAITTIASGGQIQWVFSISNVYYGASFIVATIIFAIPFIMYFVRKFVRRRK